MCFVHVTEEFEVKNMEEHRFGILENGKLGTLDMGKG